MSTTQLECGVTQPFFELDLAVWYNLVTPTWTTGIWKDCYPKDIAICFNPDAFWSP